MPSNEEIVREFADANWSYTAENPDADRFSVAQFVLDAEGNEDIDPAFPDARDAIIAAREILTDLQQEI